MAPGRREGGGVVTTYHDDGEDLEVAFHLFGEVAGVEQLRAALGRDGPARGSGKCQEGVRGGSR
eukprot:4571025-Pyramimonas_sp.AAC.1